MWTIELYDEDFMRATLNFDTKKECVAEASKWTNITHYFLTGPTMRRRKFEVL